MKTSRGRGGVIQDIIFKDIKLINCGTAMDTGMNYDKVPIPGNKTTTPIVKDITFQRITGSSTQPGKLPSCRNNF